MTRKVRKATTKKKTKALPHKYFAQQARRNETNKQLLLRSATKYYEGPSYNDHYYTNSPVVNNQTPSNIKELRSTITNKPQASSHTPKVIITKREHQQGQQIQFPYTRSVVKQSEQIPSAHWLAMDLIRRSTTPHGYFPQQSGNYTNNREYNDLQQQYRNLNVASNMNQATLQSINKANKQLEENLKEQHQQINDAQKKRNKLQEQLDKNKADLVEGNRVERETMKLRTNIYHTQEQLNETQSNNNIMQLKNYQASYVEQYNKAKAKNTQLKEELDQNTLYNEIIELNQNTEKLVAENEGLQNDINSDEFKHPNKALTMAYQENLKERDRQELLKKEHDLYIDNMQVEAKVNALAKENPNDDTAITEQANNIANEQEQIRNQQRKLDKINFIREKKEKLEDQATNLSVDIKVNEAEIRQMKESDDGSVNDAAKEDGIAKAKKRKFDYLLTKRISIAKMNDEIAENTAEANELNAHESPKEARANRQVGEVKASLEESNQLLNATKQAIDSKRQKEVTQGANEYYKSKEFNKTNEELVRMKRSEQINNEQRNAMELANKQRQHTQQSLHELEVLQNTRGIDIDDPSKEAALVQQIDYESKQVKEEEQRTIEKEQLYEKIDRIASEREGTPGSWQNFINESNNARKYGNFMYSPFAFSIQDMQQLYTDYLTFSSKSKFNLPKLNNEYVVEEEEEQ